MEGKMNANDAVVERAIHLYEHDQPLKAVQILLERDEMIDDPKEKEEFQQRKDAEHIRLCEAQISAYMEKLNSDDGWTLFSEDKKGTVVRTRDDAGEGRMTFRVDGTVQQDIFCVLACMVEPELYNTWMPSCKDCSKLEAPSNFRMLLHMVCPAKWPVADRESIMWGYGDAKDGQVVIYISTLDLDDPASVAVKPYSRSCVRMFMQGALLFEPISPTETRVRTAITIDPKLQFVPSWLLNFVLKRFCGYFIPMLEKQSAKFAEGGELHHMIKDGPNVKVYEQVKERLREMAEEAGSPAVSGGEKKSD